MFFIFKLLVPNFKPSVFRVVLFFCISIYRGYYAFPRNDFKGNIEMQKPVFKMADSITRRNLLNDK